MKPEARSQKPEARSQKPEARSQKLKAISITVLALGFGYVIGTYTAHTNSFPYSALKKIAGKFSPPKIETAQFINRTAVFSHFDSPKKVVMIGDSLTNYNEWSEAFPLADIANRGVGSDTTELIIKRLDSITSLAPEKAFILAGINDIAAGKEPNQILDNYRQIINTLSTQGSDIYVQSTIPASQSSPESWNENVHSLNQLLQAYCQETKKCTYIDLNTTLAPDGFLPTEHTTDGVHLSGAAYKKWENKITHLIQ